MARRAARPRRIAACSSFVVGILAAPCLGPAATGNTGADSSAAAQPEQPSAVTDVVETIALVPASKATQERVGKALASVIKALPKPPLPYVPTDDGWVEQVASRAGTLEGPKLWIPLEAWAECIFEEPVGEGDDELTLEVRVAVNGSRYLSPGIGSEGTAPRAFEIQGALAMEQTLIGADAGSRMALPLSPEATAAAPTVLRIYFVDSKLETRLRKIAAAGKVLPHVDITQLTASDPASIRSIIVEYYGGKRDVEALARRVDTKALRKLLTP